MYVTFYVCVCVLCVGACVCVHVRAHERVCVCVCVCARAHAAYRTTYLVLKRDVLIEFLVNIHKITGGNCQAVICTTCVSTSFPTTKVSKGAILLLFAEWLLVKSTVVHGEESIASLRNIRQTLAK